MSAASSTRNSSAGARSATRCRRQAEARGFAAAIPDTHTTEHPLPDDSNILLRLASGGPSAMRECMDRYGGLVWALARRLSPTPSDADDAVQEIFIDLWKSAARFDPSVASESTFVAMIARRRLIDRGRRRSRRLDTAALPESPPAADEPPVGERTEVVEVSRLAQAAFEQLRPEQRRVLQLAIFRGTSHEEIARSTGLPLGTVKTHARRGLIRLRELLAEQGVVGPSGETRPDAPRSDPK